MEKNIINREMKGGSEEEMLIKEKETVTKFRTECPVCNQTTGKVYSENQAKYNFRLHLETHLNKKEITEEEYKKILKDIQNE